MPSYENLVIGLSIISCCVGSGAAIRLYCQSLQKTYRVLSVFLCFQVVRSFTLLVIGTPAVAKLLGMGDWFPRPHQAYAWTYVRTEPLLWLFYILVVLELYSLVLVNYKGLQTVGRWVFLIAITLAVLISGLSVLPTLRNPNEKALVIFYYALIARGIMFSLVLFILLILFFLSWYPISLSRNLVFHTVVCTIFLISISMGYLVRNVQGTGVTHAVNVANLVITISCWAAWMLLLTRNGEATKMVVRREWTPEEEKRLVDQLTAINSSLLRATRKNNLNKDRE
jgi:hypothetical protein